MRTKLQNLRFLDGRRMLAVASVGLFLCAAVAGLFVGPKAQAATSSTINFQARLMSADGSIVPDGKYNIEFKLYNSPDAGTMEQGVCADNCVWVETRTGVNAVLVTNGYITVSLGSVNPFGANINWDQELWLTMNIGGIGIPRWDGEMSPRLRLTAVPYAFQAGGLAHQDGDNRSTLGFSTQTNSNQILLPDESGVLCIQGSDSCGFVKNDGTLSVGPDGVTISSKLQLSELGIADTMDFLCYNSLGQISVCDPSGLAELAGSGLNAANLEPTTLVFSGPMQVFEADGSVTGVDNYSAIAVNAITDNLHIAIPAPSVAKQKVGRVLYITTASDSKDFMAVLDGTGIEVTMQANSTITLVWNGSGWTVSGGVDKPDQSDQQRPGDGALAIDEESYLGAMYYDPEAGDIQCFEAQGWGECIAAPDNIVNLEPEYAGGVINGDGIGIMSTDFCANGEGLKANEELCAPGQARNFYRWTSAEEISQTRSIYVTYRLPANFKGFASDDTVKLTARVDNVEDASVTYEMFRTDGIDIIPCSTDGKPTDVIVGGGGEANVWYTYGISGNEATDCGFDSSSAGHLIIFKINLTSRNNANAYVSTLSFVTTVR
ncbi:hypothetical protein IRY61_03870 [Candidatus Saccharibacteria bacterium]|nr:hypothetical protein [Candidatus Saccharibacteria bacterium]